MRGRAFLDIARQLCAGGTEAHRRATVIHAYYALFLECRDALTRWRITIALHQNVHSTVRLRLLYAADSDLKSIGRALERWCGHRNRASYNLSTLPEHANDHLAQIAINEITAALALLDAIDADPVRRVAAITAFAP